MLMRIMCISGNFYIACKRRQNTCKTAFSPPGAPGCWRLHMRIVRIETVGKQMQDRGIKLKGAGLFVLAGLLALSAMGCAQAPASADGRMLVYTSVYPMYDFAAKIGGDKIRLVNMVPEGAEPHDWEPTASDIAGLNKARVFIYNGAGLEHWAEDVHASLKSPDLTVLEASAGIPLLEGHAHAHGHAEEGDHAHAAPDPHVWLDPQHAKVQMEAIKNVLSEADPPNRAYYEANYARYAAGLDALDQEFQTTLEPLQQRELIVSHEAFGYLCAAYGLVQVGIEGLSPDSEPDPSRMAEIIRFAKEREVKVIFFEELASPKVAETIARAIGAKTDILSPLEGLNDEQRAAGDDYFSVMRKNLAAIAAALQ